MKAVLMLVIATLLMPKLFSQTIDHWETAIYSNDTWRYTTGDIDPGLDWNQPDFNDSDWSMGQGGFGYDDGDDNTIIEVTSSVFLRIKFTIEDISTLAMGLLHMDYDDSFVAYINGVEVARSGISGNPPAFNQLANSSHEAVIYTGGLPEEYIISKDELQLLMQEGENLLSIEVHNVTANSSDLTAIAYLSFGINNVSVAYRAVPDWFVQPFIFHDSNLPIIVIETEGGADIVDDPKIKAQMKIIDHVGGNSVDYIANDYDGNIGIEIRGSFSSTLPQKSYGVETRDDSEENRNVKLLGMPKENDWILLANYNDKSFMRNAISYNLFDKMGHYSPRFKHCEVMINSDYRGLYILLEKLKRDNKRIDIAKLDEDDNAGDSITGGYIFKIDNYGSNDYWVSNYHPIDKPSGTVRFVYHDPSVDELSDPQKLYLQNYVDQVESVLYSNNFDDPSSGYPKYLDVSSFLDYFIISELSRNTDAYKKSRYFFKDKNSKGGLIHSGPVWDFDWAYKNLNDDCGIFNQTDGSGWSYKKAATSCSIRPIPCGWMVKLMEDENFRNQLGNRYHELRQTFMSNEGIFLFMDSISTLCNEAQGRHYTKFPNLGKNTGAYEVDVIPETYAGEVQKLKEWLQKRLAWLDENMPEATIDALPIIRVDINVRVFPNPASQFVFIESDKKINLIEIHSISGELLTIEKVNGFAQKIDVSNFEPGMYVSKVYHANNQVKNSKLIIKR